jgi:MspA
MCRLARIGGYGKCRAAAADQRRTIAYLSRKNNNSGFVDQRNTKLERPVRTVSAVTPRAVVVGRAAVLVVCLVMPVTIASPALPDPNPAPPPVDAVPPADGGRVPSAVPAATTTPDGWTLTVGSWDETQLPVAPLTTAVSSREYLASGTFIGSLIGPGEPRGILEVGYEIGCGIDMTTSNGVSLTGTSGITPSIGVSGPLGALPTALLPVLSTPVGGAITVGLKPGIVNVVPVDKKEFKGPAPWVMISNFHVKIDGCVGQSFIRSYAVLTRQTDQSDVVLSYVGATKAV